MSRSNSLRKLINEQLKTMCDNVYYRIADSDNIYPHIVFDLRNINTGDIHRYDYTLQIDIWDRGNSMNAIEMADTVQSLFRAENLPQTDILPTFYTEMVKDVEDPDKDLKHIQIDVVVQMYEK